MPNDEILYQGCIWSLKGLISLLGVKNKAENNLYNDNVRLVHLVEHLLNQKLVYQVVLKSLSKRQTGEHQLLYDLLMPVVDRLAEIGESEYRIKRVIDNLMLIFEYDGEAVGQSVLKYKNILKTREPSY